MSLAPSVRQTRNELSANFNKLQDELRDLNDYGNLNILMSDDDRLFCYHDKDRYKGLCYLHREFSHTRIRLVDEDWEVDLGRTKGSNQNGYVVATRPLTNEEWNGVAGGQLIVFRKGEIVYK
jgi:predicted glutamine amidotransferase